MYHDYACLLGLVEGARRPRARDNVPACARGRALVSLVRSRARARRTMKSFSLQTLLRACVRGRALVSLVRHACACARACARGLERCRVRRGVQCVPPRPFLEHVNTTSAPKRAILLEAENIVHIHSAAEVLSREHIIHCN